MTDLSRYVINTHAEFMKLLNYGNRNRAVQGAGGRDGDGDRDGDDNDDKDADDINDANVANLKMAYIMII